MTLNLSPATKGVLSVMAIWMVLSMIAGCAGSSQKDQQTAAATEAGQKGSLSRTFLLLDEQGRESGKLVLMPSGEAKLLDGNDQVIGQLTFVGNGSTPAPAASETVEAPADSEADDATAQEKSPE